MILEINDTKAIIDIQDKFTTFFPFLKLEFFEHPHHWYEESALKTAYPASKRIGDIRRKHHHGDLEIYSWSRTGDLEKAFRKKFDLNVQVFRLYHNEWVQTVGTDKLSLEEQNEIGRKAILTPHMNADSKASRDNLS